LLGGLAREEVNLAMAKVPVDPLPATAELMAAQLAAADLERDDEAMRVALETLRDALQDRLDALMEEWKKREGPKLDLVRGGKDGRP
jgi:hypothetical protein